MTALPSSGAEHTLSIVFFGTKIAWRLSVGALRLRAVFPATSLGAKYGPLRKEANKRQKKEKKTEVIENVTNYYSAGQRFTILGTT